MTLESLGFEECPEREAEEDNLVGLEGLTRSTGRGRASEAMVHCFSNFFLPKHLAYIRSSVTRQDTSPLLLRATNSFFWTSFHPFIARN